MINVKMVTYFDDHWYKLTFPPDYDGYLPKGYKIPIGRVDWLKSVTSIQGVAPKDWLANWRGSVGNVEADRILEEKRNKGSIVHSCTEVMDKKGKVIFNNEKHPAYSEKEMMELEKELRTGGIPFIVVTDQQIALELFRYKQLCEILKPQTIATELVIYSLDYRYAGSADKIWRITGGEFKGIMGQKISLDSGLYMIDIKTGTQDQKNHPMQIAAYTRAYEEGRKDERIVGGMVIYTNAEQNKSGIEGLKINIYSRDELKESFETFKHLIAIDKTYVSQRPKILELPSILSIE